MLYVMTTSHATLHSLGYVKHINFSFLFLFYCVIGAPLNGNVVKEVLPVTINQDMIYLVNLELNLKSFVVLP